MDILYTNYKYTLDSGNYLKNIKYLFLTHQMYRFI